MAPPIAMTTKANKITRTRANIRRSLGRGRDNPAGSPRQPPRQLRHAAGSGADCGPAHAVSLQPAGWKDVRPTFQMAGPTRGKLRGRNPGHAVPVDPVTHLHSEAIRRPP